MVKAWKDEELDACRRIVGVLNDCYDSVFAPIPENIANQKAPLQEAAATTQKVPRSRAEKVLIDQLVLLFLYGGIVTTSTKLPKIPVTFACEQYRDAIVILFALDGGLRIDTSLLISAARVRAFETLFGIIARGRDGQLDTIVKEFFRSAIQSSPAHTIRVIDSGALHLLYGEVLPIMASKDDVGEGPSKLPAHDLLIAHGAKPQTISLFRGKSAFAIGKATDISDAVIEATSCEPASNASIADLIVIDDALYDPDKALKSTLNMASMFQQAAAVARPGCIIVVARHGLGPDHAAKDENVADALIVPQLKILQATKVGEDDALGVWQLMSA